MTLIKAFTPVATFLFCFQLFAQTSVPINPEAKGWNTEAEGSVVSSSGNSDADSYSSRLQTTYTWDKNSVGVAGRYIENTESHKRVSKLWEASIRYERAISDFWSGYLGHGAEHDRGAGYIQRDNSDLGIKYVIRKLEKEIWQTEIGYRYSHTYDTVKENKYDNLGRFYMEYSKSTQNNVSYKLWVEYLPNFDKAKNYLINTEPSMNLMVNEIFSVKLGYLVKYQNNPPPTVEEHTDTTFTTSLIAKF